ncbi:MAG: tetratricopeptide repeat protein [Thermodesulfobacteriota bacterium]|nr:tetratricopeptide repeat protein [Thermodesulfobacteriota bacterium]
MGSAKREKKAVIGIRSKNYHVLAILVLSLCCIVIYGNTLDAPFVFDDIAHISRNPHIRLTHLDLGKLRDAALNSPLSSRPVANASLALNYYCGKYNPRGYHIFNVAVHLINGVLVYLLAFIIFKQLSGMGAQETTRRPGSAIASPHDLSITLMSLFAALIFLAHPLQAQSITYIIQRMNSMAAMFYLLSLLLYIHGRLTRVRWKKWSFFFVCLLSWSLALGSKQIAATLPFIIILYEWYFFQDLSMPWLRRNLMYLLLPFAVFLLVALIFLGSHPLERITAVYAFRDFTLVERLWTQFRVVVFYMSLMVFPHPSRLNLLHHFVTSHSLLQPITTVIAFVLVGSLVSSAFWLARRKRLVSFSILWFFGNLVIESSVIGAEMLWEYRVYLPMVGFALVLSYSLFYALSRKRLWAVMTASVLILSLATVTYLRNRIWQDDMTLWADVLSKNPQSARAHLNLGAALVSQGKVDDAIGHYRKALKIKPYYVRTHNNLAIALREKGNLQEAISHYRTALRIRPKYVDARNNLALALKDQGKLDEAIAHYGRALEIEPYSAEVHNNLGIALREKGNLDEAVSHYRRALELDPDLADAHHNLAVALTCQGRQEEAAAHVTRALRMRPDDAEAYNMLGNTLAQQGRLEEAAAQFKKALAIRKDYAEAHNNLALALQRMGQVDEAVSHYQLALKIEPDFAEAHNNLALALEKRGNLRDAILHYGKALAIQPGSAEIHNNLGQALALQGKLDDAAEHFERALKIRNDYAEAYNNLGIARARQGRIGQAIAHFSQALRLKPDYAEARHNLEFAREEQEALRGKD